MSASFSIVAINMNKTHDTPLPFTDIKEVLLFPAMKPEQPATVVPQVVGQVPGQEV